MDARRGKALKVAAGASRPSQDMLVFGRSLEGSLTGGGHFLGGLDEVYLTDRALSPQEIKRLMIQNELPQSEPRPKG
jgi:hypothetical protein